jgi:hypothetical protein
MRQVYRLLGLVRRHGAERVDDACQRALDAEAVNVGLIARMLARDHPAETTALSTQSGSGAYERFDPIRTWSPPPESAQGCVVVDEPLYMRVR